MENLTQSRLGYPRFPAERLLAYLYYEFYFALKSISFLPLGCNNYFGFASTTLNRSGVTVQNLLYCATQEQHLLNFILVAQTICDTDKPCLNGGQCSSSSSKPHKYSCDCGDWFKGINCQGKFRFFSIQILSTMGTVSYVQELLW